MNNLIPSILISIAILSGVLLIYKQKSHNKNSISAYYNAQGSFAGFIQKKQGLIRACEFSSNGSILSCSKWFKDEALMQGQNEGISQENI